MKRRSVRSLCTLLLFASCLQAAGAQEKRALIVTVGEYNDRTIPSFMPDAIQQGDEKAMRAALKARGFQDKDIRTLSTDRKSPRASLANIRAALTQLRAESQPGDTLVFYFSGHGGRMGEHFSLCASDASLKNDANDLKDTELRDWVNGLPVSAAFPTPNVTLILDCCFNQYGKGTQHQPKFMPRKLEGEDTHLLQVIPKNKAVVLRASREDEEAQQEDFFGQGVWTGVFTFELTRAMQKANPETTYVQLMQRLQDGIKIQLNMKFNNEFHQTPEMDADETLQNRPLFSPVPKPQVALPPQPDPGPVAPPVQPPVVPSPPVVPPQTLPPYVVVDSVKNGVVTLKQGKIAGITSGSEYDLYPAKASEFTPQTLAGRMKITRVQDNTAVAEIVETKGKITVNSRAVETRHAAPDRETAHLTVRVEAPADVKAAVEAAVRSTPMMGIVEDNPKLILQVTPMDGGVKERLYRAIRNQITGLPLAEVTAANSQELTADIKRRLDHLAVLRGLLSLDNPNPGFTVHLQSDKTVYRTGEYPEIHVMIDGKGTATQPAKDKPYYLSLVCVEASGIAYLRFPNEKHANNEIMAYENMLLSSKDSKPTLGYRLRAGGIFGEVTLIAIVTSEPVDWNSALKMPVGQDTPQITSLALELEFTDIQKKPTSTWAMTQVTLVIDE